MEILFPKLTHGIALDNSKILVTIKDDNQDYYVMHSIWYTHVYELKVSFLYIRLKLIRFLLFSCDWNSDQT